MRITAAYLQEHYLIVFIKLSIVCLFSYALISGISNVIDHFNMGIDSTANPLEEYFYIATHYYYLSAAFILLLPMVGICTNTKVGWILIQSYFYFLITNLVFPFTQTEVTDVSLSSLHSIAFFLILLSIILMNKKSINNLVYGIKKSELIPKNTIASVIGISITILLAILKR
ncbi:hypothetical protein [Ulvibacter litoralis]|nr:hypothetical protein [Ulvibacter litoralis]